MDKILRKDVIKAFRKEIDIKSTYVFSDKRKDSQRLKFWCVVDARNVTEKLTGWLVENGHPDVKITLQKNCENYRVMFFNIVMSFPKSLYA